jgi:hypothetical protein
VGAGVERGAGEGLEGDDGDERMRRQRSPGGCGDGGAAGGGEGSIRDRFQRAAAVRAGGSPLRRATA